MKILCFDLDDTLIDDNYKFELTFCDCIKTILIAFETRPPQIDEVLTLARKIDNERLISLPVKERYQPTRLEGTWILTYEKLCEEYKIKAKPHVKEILRGLVKQNFDPPYFLIPGVVETLNILKQLNFEMHVITTGNLNVQTRKLDETGLIKFFNEIHIVEDGDKSKILKPFATKEGKDNVVMIGNSIRSDINAALKVGVKAVHIPRGSWHQFVAEPINDKYTEIENMSQLISIVS